MKRGIREIIDVPLIGVVALLTLLSTMWQYDFLVIIASIYAHVIPI